MSANKAGGSNTAAEAVLGSIKEGYMAEAVRAARFVTKIAAGTRRAAVNS
jgi:hypothetical protein